MRDDLFYLEYCHIHSTSAKPKCGCDWTAGVMIWLNWPVGVELCLSHTRSRQCFLLGKILREMHPAIPHGQFLGVLEDENVWKLTTGKHADNCQFDNSLSCLLCCPVLFARPCVLFCLVLSRSICLRLSLDFFCFPKVLAFMSFWNKLLLNYFATSIIAATPARIHFAGGARVRRVASKTNVGPRCSVW